MIAIERIVGVKKKIDVVVKCECALSKTGEKTTGKIFFFNLASLERCTLLTSSETDSRHSMAADFLSSSELTVFRFSDFRPFPLLRLRLFPVAGEEVVEVGGVDELACTEAAPPEALALLLALFLHGGKNCASQCSVTSLQGSSSCCRILRM